MSEFLARLNRWQQTRMYKTVASVVVTLAIIAFIATLWVVANSSDSEAVSVDRLSDTPTGLIALGPLGALSGAFDTLLAQLATSEGLATVIVSGVFFAVGAIAVIMLGLSLTYLASLMIGWAVAWPLMVFEPTRDFGLMLFGIVPLVLALLTLLQLARVALSGPLPILAVAKNVLAEAVRMKISLIFIVILLLLLAVTPTVLDESQALRYRVQQWLTYGLGFSYAVLALLTVFFTVGSVAFEQRDKIIWQTMTKPVRPWEYLLGKWMGVMTLNLILLTVSATGVFLFTEYLRYQPADGERTYMVDLMGNPTREGTEYPLSEDRKLLEKQILAARVSQEPVTYRLTDEALSFYTDLTLAKDKTLKPSDRARIREELRRTHETNVQSVVTERMEQLRQQADSFAGGETGLESRRAEIEASVRTDLSNAYRSIPPGVDRIYFFDLRKQWERYKPIWERSERLIEERIERRVAAGEFTRNNLRAVEQAKFEALVELQEAGEIPPFREMTLRYTINAGTNDPTAIYDVYFEINGNPWPPNAGDPQTWGLRRVGLGHVTSFDFPMWLLDREDPALNGMMELRMMSGPRNARIITLGTGDLEVVYDAGGYHLNFLRTIATMWLKLAFIAAVGVSLATFLSFPVAALVTLAILFAGEGADFLAESLENYITKDSDGNIKYMAVPIRAISLVVAWFFEVYGSLKPAEGIADGRLMRWSSLAQGALWIGVWSTIFMIGGWIAFRRRELAIYSGH